jgi:alkylation response protein AidB-like acyl-CoA dehydrogenase
MSSGDWTDDPELRDSRPAVLRYRSATDGAITGGRSTRKHPVVFRAQMDLTLNDSERAFRDELRAWIEDNHPGPAPHGGDQLQFEFEREWQRRLHEGGWAGISWPKEYGGRGATLVEQSIFGEELARAKAPRPANVLGLVMGGPVVIAHGTEEQKERFLEPILSAEEIWCQGFSEPESGSDLASLKTRAVKEDGGWRITGQKVWTTFAHEAKWCMLVARSDPEAPKHKGITYFLMDMEQDEVEVRPLRQITGESEFNELFIEGAYVPDANVVGGEGNGWMVAITTLMNERAGLGASAALGLMNSLDELIELARDQGRADDPIVRDKVARLKIAIEGLRLGAMRSLTATMKVGIPGPEGSISKLQWSSTNQALTELAVEVGGIEALSRENLWAYRFLRSRANSIEGGTSDVLRNIVAERVLGLPRLR